MFFSCAKVNEASDLAGKARLKIGKDQNLINNNQFKFCWIVDYPMYEFNVEKLIKLNFHIIRFHASRWHGGTERKGSIGYFGFSI